MKILLFISFIMFSFSLCFAQVPLSELYKKAEKRDYIGGEQEGELEVQENMLKPPKKVHRSQLQQQVYDELFKKDKPTEKSNQ